MRKKDIYILLSIICLISLVNFPAFAQRSSVRATIEPVEILIGEHAILTLEVLAPKERNILFPVYPDTVITGIEVLAMLPPDTVIANEVMTINQKYLVTSFDSTLYYIPYIPVLDGTDTIKSNSFGLKVSSIPLPEEVLDYLAEIQAQPTDSLDFDRLEIKDIKTVIQPPFVWRDYLSYIWILLLAVLMLALLAFGVYMAFRKKNKGYFFKPEVVLPPHIIALQELDKIKADKIWQKGMEKQFYTELTDVLRKYMEKRFHFNTFERTSDEILSMIKVYTEAESSYDSLVQVLKLADLVKFAKYKALPNENDLSLLNAYLFVNQTKVEQEGQDQGSPHQPQETKVEDSHIQQDNI